MNLELLDPFARQVPDRIDSTLRLPPALHFLPPATVEGSSLDGSRPTGSSQPSNSAAATNTNANNNHSNHHHHTTDTATTATTTTAAAPAIPAYHCAFNRRGHYLAVAYGSGSVGVFDVASRTCRAVYPVPQQHLEMKQRLGVSHVSWSRRSRTLLTGSIGDANVRIVDTTHPAGPHHATAAWGSDAPAVAPNVQDTAFCEEAVSLLLPSSKDPDDTDTSSLQTQRLLPPKIVPPDNPCPPLHHDSPTKATHATFQLTLPRKSNGSMQIHPRLPAAGLAVLDNGVLYLFWIVKRAPSSGSSSHRRPILIPLPGNYVNCAAFGPRGDRVYAATRKGRLLGWDVTGIWKALQQSMQSSTATEATPSSSSSNNNQKIPKPPQLFDVGLPGGAPWHIFCKGKFVIVNSADGAIRLYPTADLLKQSPPAKNSSMITTSTILSKTTKPLQPQWSFQDVVARVKFASCDLSGDGEYVVGGANGSDFKYELYVWNTSTGVLMDKLTGPSVQLYSVAWHPARSLIAVATSDGLVDIWGHRIDWTNFAPDFQALPMNVEYVESEDELDNNNNDNDIDNNASPDKPSTTTLVDPIDVLTVQPVPVFASDSEEEDEVFQFKPVVKRLLSPDKSRPLPTSEEAGMAESKNKATNE